MFEPTSGALDARIDAVRPAAYARTRNHLDGAVTQLSPYLAHGFTTLPDVLARLRERQPVDAKHKLVYEFGWREYFHHVWHHEGEGIFHSLHEGPLPDAAYADAMPADIREARTGVPVIDTAVRELYATGWLHNHVRMWLASYVVHLRKVHWRAGADWLYAHLLDGDLASNHLGWQWIAGTGSHKPYLFNAENVARYAPPHWHSPATPIDASYETLDAIARSRESVAVAGGEGVAEPTLWTAPPHGSVRLQPARAEDFAEGQAWLMHPWCLRPAPRGSKAVGIFVADFHRRWPWSAARWRFVGKRMADLCERVVWCDDVLPTAGRSVADMHLSPWLTHVDVEPTPRLFIEPGSLSASFSQFWTRVNEVAKHAERWPMDAAGPIDLPQRR